VLKTAGGSEKALPLLDEARQRFEAVAKARPGQGAERMLPVCITEQGDCLRDLGRLDEAAATHEEGIRRAEQLDDARQIALGKGQLGTVRMQQRRYPEALAAYAEARERFMQLDEPGTVAGIWHQTGMVYGAAGQPEAAEDAYRNSLALEVRFGNVAGQAGTLAHLGMLYDDALGRTEEAVAFLRQAVEKYVEIRDAAHEGMTRNNLSEALRKLRRLDEARQEIRRAIECGAQFGHASEPWKTWAILADIETEADNPTAAAEAKRKAIAYYLACRRDGGENHFTDGRISLAVTQSLLAGDPAQAASLLQQLAANPDAAWLPPFIRALRAIVAGSRDRTLADAPDLNYSMASEILFLLETLEKSR
jgi:tetratricopeptide (TPR) repeat protein